jgi:uncharacterized protein involved in exopolysaccharide biosynthesis
MSSRHGAGDPGGKPPVAGEQHLVYILTPEAQREPGRGEMDLAELGSVLWRGWWVIALVTALFAAASIAYALTATAWYRAEVLLAPAEEPMTQGFIGPLGGLAGLAGFNPAGRNRAEPVAVLRSRDFIRAFIEEEQLLPVLFPDQWDPRAEQWVPADPGEWPDLRDAVKFFSEHVQRVSEEPATGLVTLEIQWIDPVLAAEWANSIAERLNDQMRRRALEEAERNVAYLQDELAATSVVALTDTIGRLLESEMQKLMLARGNEEFSFRIIDTAEVPKQRSRPKRTLIVAIATLLGLGLSALAVVIHALMRKRHA